MESLYLEGNQGWVNVHFDGGVLIYILREIKDVENESLKDQNEKLAKQNGKF